MKMKNYFTKLILRKNYILRTQSEMETYMNNGRIILVKFIFCIAVFLSFTVESIGQSLTFAENDINQTPTGVSVTGNMLTNDWDPGHDAQWLKSVTYFDELGIQRPGQIAGRPFQICTENGISAGTMSIYLDGSYEFNPSPAFRGEVSIKYVVENTSGATDIAMLVIQVIPKDNPIRNDRPIAHNDTNTTVMNVEVAGNVITPNDYDLENDDLSVTSVFGDLDGDGIRGEEFNVGTGVVVYGTDMIGNSMIAGVITLDSDGSYSFDPAVDFYGKLSIKYRVTDGSSGAVEADLTISVLADTEHQSFAHDDIIIGKKNISQTGNVLINDYSLESDFQTIIEAKTNFGIALTIDGATQNELRSGGSLIFDMDGSFTYSPVEIFIGTESIIYTVCDNDGVEAACDTATLYLTTIPFIDNGLGSRPGIGIRPSPSRDAGSNNNDRSLQRSSTVNSFTVGNAKNITEEFSLYPNPGIVGDGFINLSFKSTTGNVRIQITDTNGRVVRRQITDVSVSGINNLQINVADLLEGRYHLQLIDGANAHSETFILMNEN